MKSKYFILLIASLTFFTQQIFAQFRCGNVTAEKELYQNFPAIKAIQDKHDEQNKNLPIPSKNTQQKAVEKKYILPLVFHVIHDYGAENISDEQIYDQVRILNEDYNLLNGDIVQAWHEFDSIIGNINIEFRLAQIDPEGKPTNGIDRVPSNLTYGAATGTNDNAKLNPWPRYKYINVWVVKNMINGVAGYAYRPASVPYQNPYSKKIDGIIILQDYIGSIGTGMPKLSRALTHEIGHYLNLQHPWGPTNEPGVACGDDGVTDTPETKGWITCPVNKNATKICRDFRVENMQNFMEYSYCEVMFTEGQKLMMRNALVDDIAERNALWTDANLQATGIADGMTLGGQKPLKADFKTSNIFICEGKVLTLTDMSWNGTVDSRNWSSNDGGADFEDPEAQKTKVSFFEAGKKEINLSVTNSLGSVNVSKSVYVSGENATYWGFINEAFADPMVVKKSIESWIPNNYNSQVSFFKHNSQVGYLGKGSLFVNGYNAVNGEVSEIISPPFNVGYITTSTLSFYYAAATKSADPEKVSDSFKVFYSLNCGETWTVLKTIQNLDLVKDGGMHDDNFIPTASEWTKVTVGLPMAVANKNIRFKFQFTAGTTANNFYIDDVNIEGIVGLKEISNSPETLSIYPNPISNFATIKFKNDLTAKTKITLVDMIGNDVNTIYNDKLEIGSHEFTVNTTDLANGIYLLKVESTNGSYFQKISISK